MVASGPSARCSVAVCTDGRASLISFGLIISLGRSRLLPSRYVKTVEGDPGGGRVATRPRQRGRARRVEKISKNGEERGREERREGEEETDGRWQRGRGRDRNRDTRVGREAGTVAVAMMMLVAEDERRFRQLRSTFNHLRSITSAEVMAAFSSRGRVGVPSFSSSFPLPSPLPPSLFLGRPVLALVFGVVLYTSACPFVHVLASHCIRGCRWGQGGGREGGRGGALSKFARDCAPFEARLIDQVLMKMIPGAA